MIEQMRVRQGRGMQQQVRIKEGIIHGLQAFHILCPHEIMQRKMLIQERTQAVTQKKGQHENHQGGQEEEKEFVMGGAEIVQNLVIPSTPGRAIPTKPVDLVKQFILQAPSFNHDPYANKFLGTSTPNTFPIEPVSFNTSFKDISPLTNNQHRQLPLKQPPLILSTSSYMATPAPRVHGSGYSSSSQHSTQRNLKIAPVVLEVMP